MMAPEHELSLGDEAITARVHVRSRSAVGRELHRKPDVIEVNGVLFARVPDQDQQRDDLAKEQRWNEAIAAGVPFDLLASIDADARYATMNEWDAALRRIGHMLVAHGHADLWQLAYLENYTLERGYCVGDELLFLLGKAQSDQEGYEGPPGPNDRLLSAAEIAAAQREP